MQKISITRATLVFAVPDTPLNQLFAKATGNTAPTTTKSTGMASFISVISSV